MPGPRVPPALECEACLAPTCRTRRRARRDGPFEVQAGGSTRTMRPAVAAARAPRRRRGAGRARRRLPRRCRRRPSRTRRHAPTSTRPARAWAPARCRATRGRRDGRRRSNCRWRTARGREWGGRPGGRRRSRRDRSLPGRASRGRRANRARAVECDRSRAVRRAIVRAGSAFRCDGTCGEHEGRRRQTDVHEALHRFSFRRRPPHAIALTAPCGAPVANRLHIGHSPLHNWRGALWRHESSARSKSSWRASGSRSRAANSESCSRSCSSTPTRSCPRTGSSRGSGARRLRHRR